MTHKKNLLMCFVLSTTACVHPSPLEQYVSLKTRLAESGESDRQLIRRRIEEDKKTSPGVSSEIQFALSLSAPGGTEEQLTRANRILEGVLASSKDLKPSIKDFVNLQQREITNRIELEKLITKNVLRIEKLEEQRTDLLSNLTTLREQLEAAETKIDALTRIEKSIDRSKKLEHR